MKKEKLTPELQEEILNFLESSRREELIKASKIKQARIILELRDKYHFKKKGMGMN